MNVTTVSAMRLREAMGDILDRVKHKDERVIIERKGTPVAAIVSVETLERLERIEAEREAELMHLAKLAAAEDGVVSFADLLKQYETLYGGRLEMPQDA